MNFEAHRSRAFSSGGHGTGHIEVDYKTKVMMAIRPENVLIFGSLEKYIFITKR
jgi:hypothetical protein